MESVSSLDALVVEGLIVEDIEKIAEHFEATFARCVAEVCKPNVLVVGVTGAGKSSIINAVFGSKIAQVGVGQSVTKHFDRFAPDDLPVVVYDSKGLEDGLHEEFLSDTKTFFTKLRSEPQLGDQIHVIWYVINSAWARFEPFESFLVSQIFSPIPIIFLINKCDVSNVEQLSSLKNLIESFEFPNLKGIFYIVADRKNLSQSWCPNCYSDDVTFKKKTNELVCDECNKTFAMSLSSRKYSNLDKVVELTTKLLPDLAKEAFLFSQQNSFQEKDKHAKEIIKHFSSTITITVSGKALSQVGEMVSKIFILWGWNFLGKKVSNTLVAGMREEYNNQDLSSRLAMVAADTLFKRKLSRSVIACLGLLVNRPLRRLSQKLLSVIEKMDTIDVQHVKFQGGIREDFADQFMKKAFESGIEAAIEAFWEDGLSSQSPGSREKKNLKKSKEKTRENSV